MKLARPVHGCLIVFADVDFCEEGRHVRDHVQSTLIIVNLFVPMEEIGLPVACREAERILHLAYAGLGEHREEVEPTLPDGKHPSQRAKRHRARQFRVVLGNP